MALPRRIELGWGTALAALPYLAICAAFLDYVPLWDARIYAECIEKAAHGFSPADYACAHHPTLAYAGLTSLLAHVLPGRYWPILIMNAALGLWALLAFRRICRELFPSDAREANLLMLCLGVLPVFLSGAIDVNPDFGLVCFFLVQVDALLRGRFWQAAAFAILLTFSKEPGLLLALAAVVLHALVFSLRGGRKVLVAYLPSFAAVPLLGLWFATRPKAASGSPLWYGMSPLKILASFVTINLHDAAPALVLTLQFAWVLSLLVLGRWAVELARAVLRKPSSKTRAHWYLDLLFVAVLYVETRIRTFSNVRYYLPLYPLLLLCGYTALRGARPALRSLALGALASFFLLSSFRTADPVSKALVSTFPFGEHDQLALGLLDSCCGLGRDQLAYNLEHAEFHYLQNQIYADVKPGPTRGLAASHTADWFFMGRLDPLTFQRTLGGPPTGAMQELYLRPRDVEQGKRPLRLFYLRLPNFAPWFAGDEALLSKWYALASAKTYERHGYSVEVAEYVLMKTR